GMAIALLRDRLTISRTAALIFIGCGFATFAAAADMPAQSHLRILFWGVPATMIVAGATLRPFQLMHRGWAPLILLGNASYVLHLIHPFMTIPRIAAQRMFGIGEAPWDWWPLYASLLIVTVVSAALILHVAIERPMTQALRRLFNDRPASSLEIAAPSDPR